MNKIFTILFCSALLSFSSYAQSPDGTSQYQPFAPDGIPFCVAKTPWQVEERGNHRAIVHIPGDAKNADAVRVELPWRRPDLRPETKGIIVIDSLTRARIREVTAADFSSEKATIVFRPSGNPDYEIYYLPYHYRWDWDDARYGEPWNDYLPLTYLGNTNWLRALSQNKTTLPTAKVERFESRTEFDAFTPMGLAATQKEMNDLAKEYTENPVLFLEDRAFPIRLEHQLPVRWIQNGQHTHFKGTALRNEYYVWQIGAWAAHGAITNVQLQFSDLTSADSEARIAKKEITCFNLEGTNWDGSPIRFNVDIPERKVQALWCGVQIPEDIVPGTYTGKITFTANNAKTGKPVPPQILNISIDVQEKTIADKGDSELWRHSRLRWLNSTLGMDNHPVAPFGAMEVKGNLIQATGKSLRLAKNGLPQSILINDRQVLNSTINFIVKIKNKAITFAAEDLTIQQDDDGLVTWTADSEQNGIIFRCRGYMEYDGYIHYNITVSSETDVKIDDVQLVTNYTPYASEYFMGAGFSGGRRPTEYSKDWNGPWDSYWIGNELAGLHTEFLGGTYHGPLINEYKPEPAPSWNNGGKGLLTLTSNDPVAVKAGRVTILKSGARVLVSTGGFDLKNSEKDFEFALLITPLKPLNTAKHFSERYYHADPSGFDEAAGEGANVANIHHARSLNPVINYPFLVRQPLIDFVAKQHEHGRKVKLYYTIRELTTHTVEVYALKSLNHEVFLGGAGYGIPWDCEHLIDDYKPAWYTPLPGETSDAALVLNPFSRWINYYLEGLDWMMKNYKIDGIYMDDVTFDRPVLKRMRKIMYANNPGALIDLHSHRQYSAGPMNQYTGFFPYVDRLWFGEGFLYNQMNPDEWFVTFSGIPFGVMSEMLQDGGNRFLGMVYGATARHSYGPFSPVPVWDLWKSFGIEDAKMIGYWNDFCPVRTDNPIVKATAYVKPGKTLVSIGNFDTQEQEARLSIDWQALGLDPEKARITAPEVKDFQSARSFKADEPIPVKPKEGWLLIIEE
ncbi:MAG: hypothetical protein IKQ24_04980 [Verrucomicrobia bacterium]|nr:hypothetical protein [Verrucomicrobiota bacterium]